MQIVSNVFRYSAALLFGAAIILSVLGMVVIATQWNGVMEFLLGT